MLGKHKCVENYLHRKELENRAIDDTALHDGQMTMSVRYHTR